MLFKRIKRDRVKRFEVLRNLPKGVDIKKVRCIYCDIEHIAKRKIPYEMSNTCEAPEGHLKIPHLWPGQNPPGDSREITYQQPV